jgi:hypothetical protein
MPKELPYRPPSPDQALSKLAVTGGADTARFIEIESKMPRRTENGHYLLTFGDVFVMRSLKNFIVENELSELIFMSYKASPATVTVRIRESFGMLQGFALTIGIVVGDK